MKLKQLLQFVICLISLSVSVSAQTNSPNIEQGVELFQKGDYQAAITVLKRVVKTTNSATAWSYLGNCYTRQNELKNAQKAFEKAIDLDAKSGQAQTGLAYVHLLRDDEDKAIEAVRNALQIDEKNFEAKYIQGVLSYREGSFNAAYQAAEKVIAANPQFAAAYLLKSESLAQSYGILLGAVSKLPNERGGLLTDAVARLQKFIELSPNSPNIVEQREKLKGLQFLAEYYNEKAKQAAEANSNATPLKILNKPRPGYTETARRRGISGIIRMSVLFAADGKVRYALVLNKLPGGLTEQAIKAARAIQFEPETKDGKQVSVVKMVEFSFMLY